MKPTWDSIAPLLAPDPGDSDAVWTCLYEHRDWIAGIVTRGVSHPIDDKDCLQWVFGRVFERVVGQGGLRSERRGSAAAFLRREVQFRVKDYVRKQLRQERPPKPEPFRLDPPPAPEDWLRGLDGHDEHNVLTLLDRPERSGVPDTHVLAWMCLHVPDHVMRADVDRAARYAAETGSRSGETGLVRTAGATWDLLESWRDEWREEPWTTGSRTGLAWILRSADPGDPVSWARREPDAAAKARDTVGKWAIRCAEALGLPRRDRRGR